MVWTVSAARSSTTRCRRYSDGSSTSATAGPTVAAPREHSARPESRRPESSSRARCGCGAHHFLDGKQATVLDRRRVPRLVQVGPQALIGRLVAGLIGSEDGGTDRAAGIL